MKTKEDQEIQTLNILYINIRVLVIYAHEHINLAQQKPTFWILTLLR